MNGTWACTFRRLALQGLAWALLAFATSSFTFRTAWAAWLPGPAGAYDLGPADAYTAPRCLPDGHGGMFVVWPEPGGALRAQRLTADGEPVWAPDGVRVSASPGFALSADACADGAGGIIVCWWVNGDTAQAYAQRISPSGELLWGPTGVVPAPSPYDQRFTSVVPSGDGGAVVIWGQRPDPSIEGYVMGQRFSADGVTLWGSQGLPLCSSPGSYVRPLAVSDGAGGAHVAWLSFDRYEVTDGDLVYQHVDLAGALRSPNGEGLCSALGAQGELCGAAMGDGDAVFAWSDERHAGYSGADIYAQRVSQTGEQLWGRDGRMICDRPNDVQLPVVDASGDGTAWIMCRDAIETGNAMVVQCVLGDGRLQYGMMGLEVAPVAVPTGIGNYHGVVNVVSDTAAVVEWYEAGALRAQRLERSLGRTWGDSGVVVAFGELQGIGVGAEISEGRMGLAWVGGAYWTPRFTTHALNVDGSLGPTPVTAVHETRAAVQRIVIERSPTTGPVRILAPAPEVRIYDVSGRLVCRKELAAAGSEWSGTWALTSESGLPVGAGVYFVAVPDAKVPPARVVVLRP